MTKYEKYKDVPYFELISENEPVIIPSIFMFTSNDELYPFLAACETFNCTVFFDNEKIIVPPKMDEGTRLKLLCYSTVMNCREIGDAYVRYLGDLAKTNWVNNVK